MLELFGVIVVIGLFGYAFYKYVTRPKYPPEGWEPYYPPDVVKTIKSDPELLRKVRRDYIDGQKP